jgi:hypothetical protein
MNRRGFLQLLGITGSALVVPEWLLLKRTFFLPPRYGWKPSELPQGWMLEVEQYCVNDDSLRWRYDAQARDIWGGEHQFHVDMETPDPEFARVALSDAFANQGLIAMYRTDARILRPLPLPQAVMSARYV